MKRTQRGISFLLALVMVLGMIPPMAARAEETTIPTQSTETPTEAVTEPSTELPTEPATETTVPTETEETISFDETEEIPPLNEAVAADEEVKTGTWSQDMTWTLAADGTLTISGTGIVKAPNSWYPISGNSWSGNGIVHLVLEEGITGIGESVFSSIETLETVTMPAGLVSVGDSAFAYCAALKTVNQVEGLTNIGNYAFQYCSSLSGILLGEGLSEIPYQAFVHSGLKSIEFPNSVISLNGSAFAFCDQLQSVSLNEGLTGIGSSAFQQCTSLKSVTIPQSVTSIEYRAFNSCSALESITIPENVTSFGEEIFQYCDSSLKTVTLPDNMTVIPQGMFFRCENLTTVKFPANLEVISQEAFSGCWSLTDLKLPEGLKEIGEKAFLNNVSLKTVKFPKGIEVIEGSAFSGCSNLKSFEVAAGEDYYSVKDGVLYRLGGKILNSYPAGKESGSFTVPKGVQAIGNSAFAGAEADRIVLLEGVTDIGDHAFNGWTQSVVLPKSLKRIGYNAFIGNLQEVYYFGSKSDWQKMEIGDGNFGLETATIHYGGVMESGTFGNDFHWELNAAGEIMISGIGEMPDFDDYDDIPWMTSLGKIVSVKIGKGITHISRNAFCDCPDLERVTLPITLKSVGAGAFKLCPNLQKNGTVVFQGKKEDYQKVSIGENNEALKNAQTLFEYISPYLDNREIKLNGSGKAYAYYSGQSNEEISYRINGVDGKTVADPYGIIQIPLGSFTQTGYHTVTIEITQVGSLTLDPCQILEETVEVEKFSFAQEWEGSVTAAAGAQVGPGISCTPIGLEANLFKLGGKASVGVISKVSRDYDGKNNTMTFLSEVKADVGGSVKSGITKKSHDIEFSFGSLSAGVSGGVSGSYGIEIEKYDPDNLKQQLAVGVYALEQALIINPNAVIFKPIYAMLADTVYEETDCNVIYGSGFRGSASASADLLGLKLNGTNLINGVSGGGSVSVSFSQKYNDNGTTAKSSSYKTETELSALSSDTPVHIVNDGLGIAMMGTDVSVGLKKDADSQSLQVSSLLGGADALKLFLFGEYQKSQYVNYQFSGNSLNTLKRYSNAVSTYVDGSNKIIGASDVAEIADAISTMYDPIAYSIQNKSEKVHSLPLDIAKACGIEDASLEITISYKEGNEVKTETGYAIHDQHRVVTQSDKKEPGSAEKWTLLQIYTNGIRILGEKVAEFLTETWGNIKEGVNNVRGWVSEKIDAGVDWTVSLLQFDIPGALAQSYTIKTVDAAVPALLTRDIGGQSDSQNLTDSVTIGQPLVVRVTDNATGEEITDLSAEPMEFTIRYFEEDLAAANLSKDDSVVLDGGIAMYRYSDDGDYFEYVGGTNDLDAMTVTAEITRTGQYVLAVDACAPTLRYLDISDFRQNPTITAYIDDLSGLSGKSFRFCIDGVEKVNGNNLSDYYNIAAGIFTYQVPETEKLSEGEHTLSFTLGDTSENVDTYEYSFPVDLTVPEISDVSVSGFANKGSVVTVRAQVSDPNLTAVYAVLAKQQADGSWSQEVTTAMGDMGDGLWGLDYEADGNAVRIFVKAVDIAENETGSTPVEAGLAPRGDLTGDGAVDSGDAVCLLWHVLFPEEYPIHADADYNLDGTTDVEDAVYLIWHTLFPELYPLK